MGLGFAWLRLLKGCCYMFVVVKVFGFIEYCCGVQSYCIDVQLMRAGSLT